METHDYEDVNTFILSLYFIALIIFTNYIENKNYPV